MSESEKKRRPLRRWLLISLVIAVVLLSAIAINNKRARRAKLQPLVGTWRSVDDEPLSGYSIWNLRPDGTARWRRSADNKIRYSEWTIEGDELVIYQFSSANGAFKAHALSVIYGLAPTERCELIDVSKQEFTFQVSYQDPKTGETKTITRTFVATADELLESAR